MNASSHSYRKEMPIEKKNNGCYEKKKKTTIRLFVWWINVGRVCYSFIEKQDFPYAHRGGERQQRQFAAVFHGIWRFRTSRTRERWFSTRGRAIAIVRIADVDTAVAAATLVFVVAVIVVVDDVAKETVGSP